MAATGLKSFYQNINGETIEEKPSAAVDMPARKPVSVTRPIAAASPPRPATVAHQAIDDGKQYDELLQSYRKLHAMLQEAQAGSSFAMGTILETFGFPAAEIEVTIIEPLRNRAGEEPENFGMKLIESEEQWDSIERDYQTALMYFPSIELKSLPTIQRGKRLAVVMGVTAREFNAVIAAERKRERLAAKMQRLDIEREKGRKEMGVNKMPRVPASNDKALVATETPSQGMPKARTLSL